MKTCSNEGYEVSTGHFLLPGEASTVRIWLHSVKLLARGGPMKILKQHLLLLRQVLLSVQ